MDFEWDENKRQQVIAGRGVDFLDAALIFEGPVVTRPDRRRDYGEERFVSLGKVDDNYYVVVHTRRGDRTRIISAWLGGKDDQRRYQTSLARRDQEDEG